jgi:uncharacterized membrane protein
LDLEGTPLSLLESNKTATTLAVLAAGEIVGDKLPAMPKRTAPGPLLARIVSGGLCGAAISTAKYRPATMGAIAGAFGAVVGSFAGYQLRRSITRNDSAHIPDLPVALIEDAIAIGGGLWLLHDHTAATRAPFRVQDSGFIYQEAAYAAL